MSILQTIGLKRYYGVEPNLIRAVDGVNFCVEKEEFVAVVGVSGSGKTTLLNLIGGLDTPTEGNILINGTNLKQLNAEQLTIFRRSHIGFIFQTYNLVAMLNIHDNIVLPVELDGKEVDKKLFDDIINTLGLRDKLTDLPGNLSGGQQQRVAIARALITKPDIILADEPTGNLDSLTSLEVIELLRHMTSRFHQTVIMITHNAEIAGISDRILRMQDGKIVSDGGKGNE